MVASGQPEPHSPSMRSWKICCNLSLFLYLLSFLFVEVFTQIFNYITVEKVKVNSLLWGENLFCKSSQIFKQWGLTNPDETEFCDTIWSMVQQHLQKDLVYVQIISTPRIFI